MVCIFTELWNMLPQKCLRFLHLHNTNIQRHLQAHTTKIGNTSIIHCLHIKCTCHFFRTWLHIHSCTYHSYSQVFVNTCWHIYTSIYNSQINIVMHASNCLIVYNLIVINLCASLIFHIQLHSSSHFTHTRFLFILIYIHNLMFISSHFVIS